MVLNSEKKNIFMPFSADLVDVSSSYTSHRFVTFVVLWYWWFNGDQINGPLMIFVYIILLLNPENYQTVSLDNGDSRAIQSMEIIVFYCSQTLEFINVNKWVKRCMSANINYDSLRTHYLYYHLSTFNSIPMSITQVQDVLMDRNIIILYIPLKYLQFISISISCWRSGVIY